jgi:hypothetical protein
MPHLLLVAPLSQEAMHPAVVGEDLLVSKLEVGDAHYDSHRVTILRVSYWLPGGNMYLKAVVKCLYVHVCSHLDKSSEL